MSAARIYLRASTKEQDCRRAESFLSAFAQDLGLEVAGIYADNFTGTKISRPELMRLIAEAREGDVLLCESVDRLSRLAQQDWAELKRIIELKGIRIIVADLPTTHYHPNCGGVTEQVLNVINAMLLDLMATMARLDQEKRVERIRQGLQRRISLVGPVPKRGKNQQIWDRVAEVTRKYPDANAQDIAKLAGCGVATVYRVRKQLP